MNWIKSWSNGLLLLSLGRCSSTCGFVFSLRYARTRPISKASTSTFGRCRPQLQANDPQSNANDTSIQKEKGILDLIFNPYESKIPKEIEKEIFAAEANTQTAKDRTERVALYALVAFIGVLCAFFNGFITELRASPAPDGSLPPPDILDTVGFGWVYSNFLFSFLFTNKIGGFICLLGGGACGLLAEAEYDTRRINAEKIFDEMQRRRAAKEGRSASTKTGAHDSSRKVAKKRSGKESKRMNALSEVAFDVGPSSLAPMNAAVDEAPAMETGGEQPRVSENEGNLDVLGKIQEFYSKADSMAATQALLLNKKLEDAGLIEKITDETGLRVIGKEAASKLQEKDSQNTTPSADSKANN
jgi:hypothetical protein